jgi:hypothetical protein
VAPCLCPQLSQTRSATSVADTPPTRLRLRMWLWPCRSGYQWRYRPSVDPPVLRVARLIQLAAGLNCLRWSACRESFSGTSVPRRVFNCAHIAETSIRGAAIDSRGHRLLERTNCQVASGYNSTPVIRDVTCEPSLRNIRDRACGTAISECSSRFRISTRRFTTKSGEQVAALPLRGDVDIRGRR